MMIGISRTIVVGNGCGNGWAWYRYWSKFDQALKGNDVGRHQNLGKNLEEEEEPDSLAIKEFGAL